MLKSKQASFKGVLLHSVEESEMMQREHKMVKSIVKSSCNEDDNPDVIGVHEVVKRVKNSL